MAKNNRTDTFTKKPAMAGSSGISREQIAKRAYEKFEARGGAHGNDEQDWIEAERELKAERSRNN